MISISVVIITLNEEKNLQRCLTSVDTIADEVIIVDSGSSDGTLEIARKFNAKVFNEEWKGYAETKNYANSKATSSYILSLDADEALDERLIESILKVKQHAPKVAFRMKRLTNYCGQWIKHSGWYPDEKIRLFPNGSFEWTGKHVHEELTSIKSLDVENLNGDILHYSFYNKEEHISRAMKYAALGAAKAYEARKSSGFLKSELSYLATFLRIFILRKGFLDGTAGFNIAVISAQAKRKKYKLLKAKTKSKD